MKKFGLIRTIRHTGSVLKIEPCRFNTTIRIALSDGSVQYFGRFATVDQIPDIGDARDPMITLSGAGFALPPRFPSMLYFQPHFKHGIVSARMGLLTVYSRPRYCFLSDGLLLRSDTK